MRSRWILIALLAPSLSGCETARRVLAADLELTSPLPHVRVETGKIACSTPCTLRLTPGRHRLTARDPYGRMDFTFHVTLAAGLTEFEVFPDATPP